MTIDYLGLVFHLIMFGVCVTVFWKAGEMEYPARRGPSILWARFVCGCVFDCVVGFRVGVAGDYRGADFSWGGDWGGAGGDIHAGNAVVSAGSWQGEVGGVFLGPRHRGWRALFALFFWWIAWRCDRI